MDKRRPDKGIFGQMLIAFYAQTNLSTRKEKCVVGICGSHFFINVSIEKSIGEATATVKTEKNADKI